MAPPIKNNRLLQAKRDPLHPYLPEFQAYLKQAGLGANTICGLRGKARHFLVWLNQDGTPIESIDDTVLRRYRDHDCRCPRTRYRQYGMSTIMPGALWLVRFFDTTGRTRHPGSGDDGFRLLEEFLATLAAKHYRPVSLEHHRSLCRHFLAWLYQSRVDFREMDAGVVERFAHHDCVCLGHYRAKHTAGYTNRFMVDRFVGFLITRGVVQGSSCEQNPDEKLPAFAAWLRRHRGIQESTIRAHVRETGTLLPDLGNAPDQYTAAHIRDILLHRFEQVPPVRALRLALSMRMYLRFLAASGACPSGLVAAVPSAPRWRLDVLPRYLPADDIERVIASCDIQTPVGIRDRAVLLLLARLALRAGDIVNLRLDDIDWKNARLRVCGKSKQSVGLPLPQDTGDAVLAYIEQARPRVNDEKLFLAIRAPHQSFSESAAIRAITGRALKRAGMDHANLRGASLFRHSAATTMLRDGASLETIGTLLRHRSADTTAIYAKVNQPMLQDVAQAWIGAVQ